MTNRLVIRVEAEGDLRDAATWYDRERPGLGNLFLQAVWKTLETVLDTPRVYPIIESGIRRAFVHR